MEKPKFTPGPWVNEGADASNGIPFIAIAAGEHGTPSYRFICEVSPEFDEYHGFSLNDETHANARLIAEAPTMYAALNRGQTELEFLRRAIQEGDDRDDLLLRVKDIYERNAAALSKANGESGT